VTSLTMTKMAAAARMMTGIETERMVALNG